MMVGHVDDELFSFLLGTLPRISANHVEGHLENCKRCIGLLAQTREEVAQLALAVPPKEPPASTREGLLHATAELHRFSEFIEPIGQLLDISADCCRQLLEDMDEPGVWTRRGVSAVSHRPIVVEGMIDVACFVRVRPGVRFIPLDPGKNATMLLLQGSCRSSRNLYKTGDEVLWQALSMSDLVAMPGPDLIYLGISGGSSTALASGRN